MQGASGCRVLQKNHQLGWCSTVMTPLLAKEAPAQCSDSGKLWKRARNDTSVIASASPNSKYVQAKTLRLSLQCSRTASCRLTSQWRAMYTRPVQHCSPGCQRRLASSAPPLWQMPAAMCQSRGYHITIPRAMSSALSRLECCTGVHLSPAEFQPISSHSKHGAKHGARLRITQTWMDSSSVASSWRMWRRPSWDDASF